MTKEIKIVSANLSTSSQPTISNITSHLVLDDGNGGIENISKLTSITADGNIVVDTTTPGEAAFSLAGELDLTAVTTESLTASTSVSSGGTISAVGAISGASIASNNNISAGGTIAAVGAISGASIASDYDISAGGDITATGDIVGTSITSNNNISAGGTIAAVGAISGASLASDTNISATGDITSQSDITASGDVNGANLHADSTVTIGGYTLRIIGETPAFNFYSELDPFNGASPVLNPALNEWYNAHGDAGIDAQDTASPIINNPTLPAPTNGTYYVWLGKTGKYWKLADANDTNVWRDMAPMSAVGFGGSIALAARGV